MPHDPQLDPLIQSLAHWSSLSDEQRRSRRLTDLTPALASARLLGLGGDFLRALKSSLSEEDVCALHSRAIVELDLAGMQEVEAAFPSEASPCVRAPYPGSGIVPLPLLLSSDLGKAAAKDPAHPKRLEFDALFENLLEWSVDAQWLDTPLLADWEEPEAEEAAADLGDACGFRPLHFAAALGRADLIKTLLAAGANPDGAAPPGSRSLNGETDPCLAGSPLHQALNEGFLDCAKTLLDAGADPNLSVSLAQDDGSMAVTARRPIEIALRRQWREAAELLLRRGAALALASTESLAALDSRAPIDPAQSDPFFGARMRCQRTAERLIAEKPAEQSHLVRAVFAPPERFFDRLALGWAVVFGRTAQLPAVSVDWSSAPGLHWARARAALISGDAPGLQAALLAVGEAPKPAESLAWIALTLCCAPGEADNAPARLECLRELALASEANPHLRADFRQRSSELGGLGVESAVLCLGPLGAREALGGVFDELAGLQRAGSADLSSLSLAALGAMPDDAAALARSLQRSGLAYPRMSPVDPGPLAWALKASRFDSARALAEALAPLPEDALERAREALDPASPDAARGLALIERCALSSQDGVAIASPARAPRL